MTSSSWDGLERKPRRKSGLFRSVPVGMTPFGFLSQVLQIGTVLLLLLAGCGPTAPRFRVADSRSGVAPTDRPPSGSKPDSLASAHDDMETSSTEADKVKTGSKSFKTEKNVAISNLDQAKMMREISKMMGVSYKLGGADDEGIDCSAYTMNVYKASIGTMLPRSSAEQSKIGSTVEYADLKFGDLVFFNTTGEPSSHVGIYLGDDLFAHASVSLGVTISSLESFYYKKRYEGARRVLE